MKILLLGEFSGLHNNLRDGLLTLGHQVQLAAGTDGFKNFPNDIALEIPGKNLKTRIYNYVTPFLRIYRLINYDVMQTINPFFPNGRFFPLKTFYCPLLFFNKKSFLVAAGSDAFFWKNSKAIMRYGPFEDFKKYDARKASMVGRKYYMETESAYEYNAWLSNGVNGIIPVMWEYKVGYKNHIKLRDPIPLPINLEKIPEPKFDYRRKLNVFHGVTRYGFKGTRHIEKAFNKLEKSYPGRFNLIISPRSSYSEYLRILEDADILIDQVNSYSPGMNALIGLAMGKVVLSGNESEAGAIFGASKSPILNVTPNHQSIVDTVINVDSDRKKFDELRREGREYIRRYHNHIDIAAKYVSAWSAE
jgi:glycosyltransferase involved in cell wall biosynthesis